MNNNDERDYEEEAAVRADIDREAAEELAAVETAEEAARMASSTARDLPRGELAAVLSEPGGNTGGQAAAGVLVATALLLAAGVTAFLERHARVDSPRPDAGLVRYNLDELTAELGRLTTPET